MLTLYNSAIRVSFQFEPASHLSTEISDVKKLTDVDTREGQFLVDQRAKLEHAERKSFVNQFSYEHCKFAVWPR